MENASKALIMAGSILIAIIVISLGIVIYRNMSQSVTNNSKLDKEYITAFNSRITPYLGENISGKKILEVISLISNFNKYELGKYYKVSGINDSSSGFITTITVEPHD